MGCLGFRPNCTTAVRFLARIAMRCDTSQEMLRQRNEATAWSVDREINLPESHAFYAQELRTQLSMRVF